MRLSAKQKEPFRSADYFLALLPGILCRRHSCQLLQPAIQRVRRLIVTMSMQAGSVVITAAAKNCRQSGTGASKNQGLKGTLWRFDSEVAGKDLALHCAPCRPRI
jgi:hypothetical protein